LEVDQGWVFDLSLRRESVTSERIAVHPSRLLATVLRHLEIDLWQVVADSFLIIRDDLPA
jgi:hypothetical protein